MNTRVFSFIGASTGPWQVTNQTTLCGDALPAIQSLSILQGDHSLPSAPWVLKGITSHDRYVERAEKDALVATQQGLGRPEARLAALIPIRKNAAWWALTQDERRAVFEAQSHHIEIGMKYLPPIARRLHHCRDLTQAEPFDFVTWFEFAPEHAADFDAMLEELRTSAEWGYVDREIDIRLRRVVA